MAVLSILSVILANLAVEVGQVVSLSENQNAYRLHARAVLDYIGRELRRSNVAINQMTAISQGKGTLQFLITPSAALNYPDSIFWQAPIATDDRSRGDMAEIGYFVRWSGGEADLCRFFVNPTDTSNYLIYTASSGNWITSNLLNTVAASDQADSYNGLFLENVLGMWIQAYPDPSVSTAAYANPYDSSNPPSSGHPLPASVTISLVVLDPPSALRLKKMSSSSSTVPPAQLQGLYKSNTSTAQQFADQVNALPGLANGAGVVSVSVSLDNYR